MRDPESRSPYGPGNGPLIDVIRCPWPPKELSPNSRKAHRYTKDARNGFKTACFYATKEARAFIPENAHLSLHFYPPDNRKRDLDNMLAAMKAGLDGIALAAGIDDYGWSLSIHRMEPTKGGAVVVRVCPPEFGIIEHRGTVS